MALSGEVKGHMHINQLL